MELITSLISSSVKASASETVTDTTVYYENNRWFFTGCSAHQHPKQ